MGAGGEDIMLSPAARKVLPYNIEVKRKKAIAICRFLEQADSHGKHNPLSFFREDRGKWYVAMEADHFLALLTKAVP